MEAIAQQVIDLYEENQARVYSDKPAEPTADGMALHVDFV
jgi:hypothetical protein